MAGKPYYSYGLVIGKFDPYHTGHRYLIQEAAKSCKYLTVLVVDSRDDLFHVQKRIDWICADNPGVSLTVRGIPDIYDDDNSAAWAKHTKCFFVDNIWPNRWTKAPWTGSSPGVVFTSEDYGPEYARHLGIEHVMVDRERTHVPISATIVRADPFQAWTYIPDVVRPDLVTKIVVMGPESSGTTTLAQDTAIRLGAPCVAEYGRFYCEAMNVSEPVAWHGGDYPWTKDDFLHIAQAQSALERRATIKSNGLIICDTDAIATRVFYKHYMGTLEVLPVSPDITADLYIVTNPDEVPFIQDGTRSEGIDRKKMFWDFIEECENSKLPVIWVSGDREEMLHLADIAIGKVLTGKRFQRGSSNS